MELRSGLDLTDDVQLLMLGEQTVSALRLTLRPETPVRIVSDEG